MPTMVLLQEDQATPFALKGDVIVLGRAPECEIQLDSNMVSRRHAQLTRDGDSYFVEDLNSGNGTFVNGKRIAARTLLHSDDRVKLGPILLRFEATAPARKARGLDETFKIE